MTAVIADAGGSLDYRELEEWVGRTFGPRIDKVRGVDGHDFVRPLFEEALKSVVNAGLVNTSGSRLLLTDKGRMQASLSRSKEKTQAQPGPEANEHLDLSGLPSAIEYTLRGGAVVHGHLTGSTSEFHGRPLSIPASALLDQLYSVEINGEKRELGFFSTLQVNGANEDPAELLGRLCGIKLPGMEPSHPANSYTFGRSRSRTRRTSWPTLLCEVIFELGGHADWQSIAMAIEKRTEASEIVSWREEAMQALRNNTSPRGREYFDAVEIGGRGVFALSDYGKKLVKRRFLDDRAPILSKLLAEAVSDESSRLTDMEIYCLLFLATRLGRARDARRLLDRLPRDFPDEDSYAMIPVWIDQAEASGPEGL